MLKISSFAEVEVVEMELDDAYGVWSTITQISPQPEIGEIKRVIGSKLIDENAVSLSFSICVLTLFLGDMERNNCSSEHSE